MRPPQPAELIDAVREAIARDATKRAQSCERAAINARLAQLTPREREVLRLLRTGMLNKQIAAALGVVEQTIKVHRGQILEKMEVRSAVALMDVLHRANLPANFGSSEGIKRRRLGPTGMSGFSSVSRAARQPPRVVRDAWAGDFNSSMTTINARRQVNGSIHYIAEPRSAQRPRVSVRPAADSGR